MGRPCCARPLAVICRCTLPAALSALQDFTQEVFGVGHRVVHGREISESVLIT